MRVKRRRWGGRNGRRWCRGGWLAILVGDLGEEEDGLREVLLFGEQMSASPCG